MADDEPSTPGLPSGLHRLIAIRDRLREQGHDVREITALSSNREAYLAGAPMILDAYTQFGPDERWLALGTLQGRVPSRPLAIRLHQLLLAEGEHARDEIEDSAAGYALAGLAAKDRDLLLELARDGRLSPIVRAPMILSLAKKRDLRVIPAIEDALSTPDLHSTALEAIGLMRLHAFAPQVHDALHDRDVECRQAARKALRRLSDGRT